MTDKALRNIYNTNTSTFFDKNLWDITTGRLNKAVSETFKGDGDKPFVNKVKYQNSLFSAFKSTNQTRTLQHLKIASKAKTFTEFKKAAQQVTKDYNKNWLKTEFATAKQRLRSAQQFKNAERDGDLYPNIEYMPSRAANPREAHKRYYGVILSILHPFWNTHLPPFDWGCQCWWRTTAEPPTSNVPNDLPKPVAGLDTNTAKTGQVFSFSHDYFKGSGRSGSGSGSGNSVSGSSSGSGSSSSIIRQNIAFMNGRNIDDFTYFSAHKKTMGAVYSFEKLGAERVNNIKIGKAFARDGNEVQLFGIDKIDAKVNGLWNEFKTPQSITHNAIDKNLQKANSQLKRLNVKGDVTFDIDTPGYSKGTIMDALKDRLNRIDENKIYIERVHFIVGGKYKGYAGIDDILNGNVPI